MPVKTDRLVTLLFVMFVSLWLLKSLLFGLLPDEASMATSKVAPKFESEKIDSKTLKYKFNGSYRKFLRGLAEEDETLDSFVRILKDVPFPAFFFETPSVTSRSLDSDFEFVLARADDLEGVPSDQTAFSDHFSACESSVAVFPNLGGDALMVVPCPLGGDTAVFSSLGPFMKDGPRDIIRAFWQRVGAEALNHIKKRGSKPVWMSTSGLGVYWLHLRLDSRPKYYTHQTYKRARNMEL